MSSILFLTNSMGTGGVGNQLYNISMRLQQHGYDIKIRVLSPLGRFGEKTAESGIDVKSLGLNRKLSAPIALYRIRRLIRSFKPDIIHTNMFHATIIGRLAAAGTKIPTISTIHTTYEQESQQYTFKKRDWLYMLTDPLCDKTTFVGEKAKERYTEIGAVSEDKAIQLHNGVDLNEFSPKEGSREESDPFRWIIVGNLLSHKGHKFLLQAVKQLSDEQYGFHLQVIGGGPLEEELKQLAERLDIIDCVSFEGRVLPAEVPNYLNSADAFVLSSLREGFGLVVAEAMACELPVVATNTSGPSEIVENGETGFIAQRGSPEDLAAKMKTLMDLPPKEQKSFGNRGRQRVKENYSIDKTVSKWIDIYEEYN